VPKNIQYELLIQYNIDFIVAMETECHNILLKIFYRIFFILMDGESDNY
jgi:hypothetical protein